MNNEKIFLINEDSKEEIKIDSNMNVKIIVGKNSEVRVTDTSDSNVNILVGENSKVNYLSIKNENSENLSIKKAEVERDGKINWLECCLGSGITKSIIRTELIGEGSESESFGVIFGSDKEIFDIKNEVIHIGNRSKSNMLTRVVLDKEARANYNGLIKVNSNARGCEGYQKKETILLSDDAKIDAVPNLEIENNDVRCSHGATISQIDEGKLFYMQSRGIDEKSAKRTIIEGFFDPILVTIDDPELKESIKNSISKRLGAIK